MLPLPFSNVSLDAGAATSSPETEVEVVSVSTIAATAVATGHLMFKLVGYSRLKARHGENGNYIKSSTSKVGGHTWTIACFLNGDGEENAGFVSLYLHLCGDGGTGSPAVPVHAECEFALVPHQGTSPENDHQEVTYSKSSQVVRTFGVSSSAWGFRQFISVEELERSMFLKDDRFAVRCTVTVVEERTMKEEVLRAGDLARLGMLCKCDDDLCKRYHDRPVETFLERFAKFCYSICHGPSRYVRIN